VAGLLYTCVAMIDSEVTSTVAAAGGQYAQAKHIVGPLMAFNVGLFLVFAYTMLEAANAITLGYLVQTVRDGRDDHAAGEALVLHDKPFIVLTIMFLAWLNYRGVYATLTFNLVITAIAFIAIIILFFAVKPWTGEVLKHNELLTGCPTTGSASSRRCTSVSGTTSASKGTCQAAEEVRSPARSLPLGTMTGIMTLLIAATMTWYICAGLMPWEYLGQAVTPLFDAARFMDSMPLMVLLFIGTIFSTLASANGCINDASRAWFSMARDRYLPQWFGAVHPKYRTPYRAIVFLVPVRGSLRLLRAARSGDHVLDPVGSARIHVHDVQRDHVPAQVAARHDPARVRASHASAAGSRAAGALRRHLFRGVPRDMAHS
jgi:ethanolamine permease